MSFRVFCVFGNLQALFTVVSFLLVIIARLTLVINFGKETVSDQITSVLLRVVLIAVAVVVVAVVVIAVGVLIAAAVVIAVVVVIGDAVG